jgi:hypothetical protein
MNRLIRILAAACLIVLSLCACTVLFMGPFNSDLAQATAWRDLSADVSADAAISFELSIVQCGKTEYVLLYSSMDFDAARSHLMVLTPELEVLSSFTMEDIRAVDPDGASFSGDAVLYHQADGTVVIGNLVASPTDGGLMLLRKLSRPANTIDASLEEYAIEGPASADFTWTGFQMNTPSVVTYRAYPPDWSTSSTLSINTGSDLWLRAVLANPTNPASNAAILVFGGKDDSGSFYMVPKDPDLANGLFGRDLSSYPSFSKLHLDSSSVTATEDGLVGYDNSISAWVWFTPSAPDDVRSLPARNRNYNAKTAFSFSNGWYCVWDPDTRELIRYEKWW